MTISHSLHDAFHYLSPSAKTNSMISQTATYGRDTVHEFTRHDYDIGDKEQHHYQDRADSFAQMSDIAMTEEDDAIIKCICGYGKGIDDDNAICCDECSTWQHTICYFPQTPLPKDDESYFCGECRPRNLDVLQVPLTARERMRRKLRNLERMGDQILEMECEARQREEELVILEHQKCEVEHDLQVKGPMLEEHRSYSAFAMLDDWNREYSDIVTAISRTSSERDAIRRRIAEVEDDVNRVSRNERTREEEIREKWRIAGEGPRLFTTACALGRRAAVPHTLPPILMVSLGGKVKKAV